MLFGFLEHGHALEQLAFGLVLAELADRSQQGLKERFLRGTATYDVSADAVDRGIEVVEADIGLAQGIGPYDLLREQLHAVVQDTTWSLSQRTGRLTCSMISGVKSSRDEILS